jgi:hypothetical protein
MLDGQVQVMFDACRPRSSTFGPISCVLLAVTMAARSPALPDIPDPVADAILN